METRILLILVFSYLAFFASEISSQNTACETGWSNYGEDCYKIFQRFRYGLDAQKSCVSEGGNLLKISSWAHWLWLQSMSQLDSSSSQYGSRIFVKLFLIKFFYFWTKLKLLIKVGGYSPKYKEFYWHSDGSSLNNNYWCNATVSNAACNFYYYSFSHIYSFFLI